MAVLWLGMTVKRDDCPRWFKRFASIDQGDTIRLVGHCRSIVTLTRCTLTDEHTLWLYDYPVMIGPRELVRWKYDQMRF